MQKLNIVIDTNVFISAFFFGFNAEKALKKAALNYNICFSDKLVKEVLTKFIYKFEANANQIQNFKNIVRKSKFFDAKEEADICRDKNDNFILDLAEVSKACFILTGDKDLLVLKSYRNTKIININQFLKLNHE